MLRGSIDPQNIQALARSLEAALEESLPVGIESVAEMAVKHMADLEEHSGREAMASLWDHTAVQQEGDSFFTEVFSHAEDIVFYNKTSRRDVGRVKSSEYHIDGKALLIILEYGAPPHFIFPRNASVLAIPSADAATQTAAFVKRNGAGSFLPPGRGDYTFARDVLHPGVHGDHHLQDTWEWLIAGMAEISDQVANRIAVAMPYTGQ